MTKLKHWLCEKYLPAYCRDALLEENARLTERLQASEREVGRLNAYIDGLHVAIRRQGRITIHCKEVTKP